MKKVKLQDNWEIREMKNGVVAMGENDKNSDNYEILKDNTLSGLMKNAIEYTLIVKDGKVYGIEIENHPHSLNMCKKYGIYETTGNSITNVGKFNNYIFHRFIEIGEEVVNKVLEVANTLENKSVIAQVNKIEKNRVIILNENGERLCVYWNIRDNNTNASIYPLYREKYVGDSEVIRLCRALDNSTEYSSKNEIIEFGYCNNKDYPDHYGKPYIYYDFHKVIDGKDRAVTSFLQIHNNTADGSYYYYKEYTGNANDRIETPIHIEY